jgi:hypothetical protein
VIIVGSSIRAWKNEPERDGFAKLSPASFGIISIQSSYWPCGNSKLTLCLGSECPVEIAASPLKRSLARSSARSEQRIIRQL